MPGPRLTSALTLLLLLPLLGGCSPDERPGPVPLRTVKLAPVARLTAQAPLLPGLVRQPRSTALAFENGGRVLRVAVDVGARVAAGQVLAEQDGEPARLRLDQASARVQAARVELDQRRAGQRRARQLFAEGNLAKAELEGADAALGAAQAQQRGAEAELALARRALAQTRLVAPFAGQIILRVPEPLRLLGAGETLLGLQAEGERQVVVQVPAALAQGLTPGAQAKAYATRDGAPLALRLIGLSPRAEQGLLQEAVFALGSEAPALPSGSLLDVRLPLPAQAQLAVPLGALLPGQRGTAGQVFVYQPETQQVKPRPVTVAALRQDQALIASGLAEGEQIVVAGAAFLRAGEHVLPYQPSTVLTGE
ncbi:efflux RND transporter periplasmic adaptor subunit [Pseudomonas oryzihabitans]|jgi:RND family efflux transporter MFP subunit|uniref:efflux RND transporter periplasmic adaptor subunit n=1 Tax=Pseudomonas oryzihabitans TaxID=47885 RepID=UPI002553CDDC|nr:efflux RND transporter periplasmic adaptor subunit [Pseudomonas oryzihabitans]MDK8265776.1 efflux RND transporter periplasmic adaptor subunit [Pseudomonas oryzihabitans]